MFSVQSTGDRVRRNDRMPQALLASEDCNPRPNFATEKPVLAGFPGRARRRTCWRRHFRSSLFFRFPSDGIQIAQP